MSSWKLIQNASVIDGLGSPPRAGVSVLVRDGVIEEVGTVDLQGSVPRGDVVTEINAAGKTVMPGLIDAHCHMTYGESRAQEEQDLYTSVETRTLRAAFNLQKVLRAGVTSISQPGGSYYIGVALREAVQEGLVQGPRVASAGRYLTTSNSLTDWYPTAVGVPESSIGVSANTRDEMVAETRRQVKNGVDFIKVADSPFGEHQAVTYDEMCAITEMTHMLRKRATIHARGSAEVDAAVRAEFDWIMHGNMMTDETIERLANSHIPLVPTLTLLHNWAERGHLIGVPTSLSDACKELLATTAETLHKAHQAGVVLVAGTDTGFSATPYGEWHALELQLLVDYAGLTPLEAIQAGTANAGVTMGLEGHVGTVEPGALADLLIVNGDPSTDLSILLDKSRIEIVMLGGRIVEFDDDALRQRAPNDRAQVFSTEDLTLDRVRVADSLPLADTPEYKTASSDREVAHEISRAGTKAHAQSS